MKVRVGRLREKRTDALAVSYKIDGDVGGPADRNWVRCLA